MRQRKDPGTEDEGGAGDGDGAVEEGDSGVVDAPLAVPDSAAAREGGRVGVGVDRRLGRAEADGDGDLLHERMDGGSATAMVGTEKSGFEISA